MSAEALAAAFLRYSYEGSYENRAQLAEHCVAAGLKCIAHFGSLPEARLDDLACCLWPDDVEFVRKIVQRATEYSLNSACDVIDKPPEAVPVREERERPVSVRPLAAHGQSTWTGPPGPASTFAAHTSRLRESFDRRVNAR